MVNFLSELRKSDGIYWRIHALYFLAVPPFLSKVQYTESLYEVRYGFLLNRLD